MLQVATALLVAGPTLTFWIPGQTLFASASSYSSLVQSLPVQWFPYSLIHLEPPRRGQPLYKDATAGLISSPVCPLFNKITLFPGHESM